MEICSIHGKVLVCPTCVAVERGRVGGKKKKRRARAEKAEKAVGQSSAFSARDCLALFHGAPEAAMNCAELVARVAPENRAAAKSYIFRRVQYLYKHGLIERISDGHYRLKA